MCSPRSTVGTCVVMHNEKYIFDGVLYNPFAAWWFLKSALFTSLQGYVRAFLHVQTMQGQG